MRYLEYLRTRLDVGSDDIGFVYGTNEQSVFDIVIGTSTDSVDSDAYKIIEYIADNSNVFSDSVTKFSDRGNGAKITISPRKSISINDVKNADSAELNKLIDDHIKWLSSVTKSFNVLTKKAEKALGNS